MNILGIDYGLKRIGLAISISGIISPLAVIQNDTKTLIQIKKIINQNRVEKIYIGISEGNFAVKTHQFVKYLKTMINLPIETVEEAVSTIEADAIYLANKNKKSDYKKSIDSVAAAVILRRVID
ncbi:MAG: Holliday junction resolvase RuvX [Candidatus Shapirobacteria bacterium]|jgi:putative Holliday junction resolvase